MTDQTAAAPAATYTCPFCRQPSVASGVTCPNCGAPIDVTRVRDDSGWTALPPIPDMARIQFGRASCQITGDQVPVANMALSGDEQLYFSHHVILWSDPGVRLDAMPMSGAVSLARSGMPLVMMTATGPGNIAFSQDHCGELVAIPLNDGQGVDVREHRFLTATTNVGYTWTQTFVHYNVRQGKDNERRYPVGQYIDQFQSQGPGLLLLHVPGNVFIRDLADGETLLVQPGSLVYKDVTVAMQLHLEYPAGKSGLKGDPAVPWLRVTGPGRLATCSVFGDGGYMYNVGYHSEATTKVW